MNINKLVIAGRIGKEPELKTTQSGTSVCSLSVAVNRKFKDSQGNQQEQTEWVNCVAWGKTGETIAQYFQKGNKIYLEGRLQTRSWDVQDGSKRYATEMIVDTFQFVESSKQNNEPQQATNQTQHPAFDKEEVKIEQIPF